MSEVGFGLWGQVRVLAPGTARRGASPEREPYTPHLSVHNVKPQPHTLVSRMYTLNPKNFCLERQLTILNPFVVNSQP